MMAGLARGTTPDTPNARDAGWESRTVLITGGTSGIGRATATLLLETGATVLAVSRRPAHPESELDSLERFGARYQTLICDVSDTQQIDAMMREVEAIGPLDGAVNCAGYQPPAESLARSLPRYYDTVFTTNVHGTAWCMMREIELMSLRGRGSIVNVASVAGIRGTPKAALYCASKHAVVGLSAAVALEVADAGIRVNAVSPGATATPMAQRWRESSTHAGGGDGSRVPLRRSADPSEVAHAICFLLSDASSYITGSNLIVDGGLSTR